MKQRHYQNNTFQKSAVTSGLLHLKKSQEEKKIFLCFYTVIKQKQKVRFIVICYNRHVESRAHDTPLNSAWRLVSSI
jgi:hypothetical protein